MLHFVYHFWDVHVRGSNIDWYIDIHVSFDSCCLCDSLLIDLYLWVASLIYFFILCCVNLTRILYLFIYYLLPHMRLCVCWVCQEYTGWFDKAAVYTCNRWIVVRLNFYLWALLCKGLFTCKLWAFIGCFVTDCQRGSLLGSKVLGFYVFRTLICNVGKPWSKQCT